MTILINADGCPGVSDVMKNKTSSRTLPLIRLNLRLLAEMVGILPRAKQQPTGLIACGINAAALFEVPSLAQKEKPAHNVYWFFLVRWKGLEPPAY